MFNIDEVLYDICSQCKTILTAFKLNLAQSLALVGNKDETLIHILTLPMDKAFLEVG